MVKKILKNQPEETFSKCDKKEKIYHKGPDEWYSFEAYLKRIEDIVKSKSFETLKNEKELKELLEALNSPYVKIRETAAKGLFDAAKKIKLNKKVLMPIILAIDDNDSNVRSTLRAIIEFALENKYTVQSCIKEIGETLNSDNVNVKRKAIKTLDRLLKEGISVDSAIPYVMRVSKDEDEDSEIRYFAKKILLRWEESNTL
ncbi:MAG: hypothetical protein QW035_03235 [Candidatus Anstonellales archaeon]